MVLETQFLLIHVEIASMELFKPTSHEEKESATVWPFTRVEEEKLN